MAALREVNMARLAPCWRLSRSEVPITFSRHDYPHNVPSLGQFPLIVSSIVGWAHLTKVLVDGRSGLNVLYAGALDHRGIPRESLCPSGAPFFGIIHGVLGIPLGSIWLLVMFRDPTNFRKEFLDFEVVDFSSPYHALPGQPCTRSLWLSHITAA